MDVNCVFCKIIGGEVPADKQAETEDYMVIPDISPQAPIHLLFVSKSHGEELANVTLYKLGRMLAGVQEMITDKKLDQLSYRIVMNGAGANLVHNHLHIHLLGSVTKDRPV